MMRMLRVATPLWLIGCIATSGVLAAAQSRSSVTAAPESRPVASQPARNTVTIDDFEQPGTLLAHWTLHGAAQASRVDLGAARPADGVAGRVFALTVGDGSVVERRLPSLDAALADCESFVMRIDAASASPERPVVMFVRFHERDRRASWSRRVKIEKPGWHAQRIPLRTFRASKGAAPRWERVDSISLQFRTPARVMLDGLELTVGAEPGCARPTIALVRRVAFPAATADVRESRRGPFLVLTDSTTLDTDKLLDALMTAYERLNADFPQVDRPDRPVVLLIFANESAYRTFWPRYAEALDMVMPSPTSDGFTALGVASGFCATDDCHVRPVFVHEAAHALMEQMLGLASGDWLTEGLATRYQLAASGQALSRLVQEALQRPDARMPWVLLLNGGEVPPGQYWQAASVIEWLLDDPQRRKQFDCFLETAQQNCNTNMQAIAPRCFGAALAQLER
ncbi:MAG: hypothetical protein D6744_15775, partial [Planctomycetota bacterium]